jgi:hypothetical protein
MENYKIFKIYFPYQIMIDLAKEIIVFKIVIHINKILNMSRILILLYMVEVFHQMII